jgi:hypothetical protein
VVVVELSALVEKPVRVVFVPVRAVKVIVPVLASIPTPAQLTVVAVALLVLLVRFVRVAFVVALLKPIAPTLVSIPAPTAVTAELVELLVPVDNPALMANAAPLGRPTAPTFV